MSEHIEETPLEATNNITLQKELPPDAPPSPRDGDFVIHCAHISERQPSWFWLENTTFKRGESTGVINWMALCVECELLVKENPQAQVLSGLGVFQSEPVPTLVAPKFEESQLPPPPEQIDVPGLENT
jgi:hypothetical protein